MPRKGENTADFGVRIAAMTGLARKLGLPSLTFYGVGLIIGAGIYSVIGAAAGVAGEGLWLSFAIGSVIALLTGLSYAELATMFPEAGAEFVFMREAFPRHRWSAFVVGCVLTLAASATATTVSVAFAGYLRSFLSVPILVSALLVLAAAALINIAGITPSSWVNMTFTLIEVAGLVVVITIGARAEGFGRALKTPPSVEIVVGAAIIFFVYLGFEEIANLAEEALKPERDIPRAIFVSLAVTTALYLCVALAVVALIPAAKLSASESPLSDAVRSRSDGAALALGVIALFSTANTALITMIAASRMLFSMARSGEFPAVIARVLPARKTPWVAAIVVFCVASAILPLGKVKTTGSLASFMALIAFASVHLCVIVLRFRKPKQKRPFRVPLAIGRLPLLPCVGIATAVALLFHFEPVVLIVGTSVIALSLAVYPIVRRFRPDPGPARGHRAGGAG
jgi:APA family basic amino acid/polyamine antiporter